VNRRARFGFSFVFLKLKDQMAVIRAEIAPECCEKFGYIFFVDGGFG
jgi:hypothetical protein